MNMFLYAFPKYLRNIDNGTDDRYDKYGEEAVREEALFRILDKIDFKELAKELNKEDKKVNVAKGKEEEVKKTHSESKKELKEKDNKDEEKKDVKKDPHRGSSEKKPSEKDRDSENKKELKEKQDKDKGSKKDSHKGSDEKKHNEKSKDSEDKKELKGEEDKNKEKKGIKKDSYRDSHKKEHSRKSKINEERDQIGKEPHKQNNNDENSREVRDKYKENKKPDMGNRDEKKSEDKVTKENCDICLDEFRNILKKLVGERVTLCLEGCLGGIINDAVLLAVEEGIMKLKTKEKTIILVPINELVSVKSEELTSIKFNSGFKEVNSLCSKSMDLNKYFNRNVGKVLSLRTKGEGEFKYISRKKLTVSGKGFIILEGNMLISICKILLVEELE